MLSMSTSSTTSSTSAPPSTTTFLSPPYCYRPHNAINMGSFIKMGLPQATTIAATTTRKLATTGMLQHFKNKRRPLRHQPQPQHYEDSTWRTRQILARGHAASRRQERITGQNSRAALRRCWAQDEPIGASVNSTHWYCSVLWNPTRFRARKSPEDRIT